MPKRLLRPLAALLAALLLAACAAVPQPFELTVAHVNDTHSALEPAEEVLRLDGQNCRVRLGGFARLKGALDELRARQGNLLFLHAGDAVQGTLYFNLFGGRAEFEFLNAAGLDAMTLGNHEFDRGPAHLGTLLPLARFPVVSANLDASREPALAGRVQPYALFRFGREQVAVIGSTTPATPLMTADVGGARFLDPAASIAPLVQRLKAQGVRRVILLSHNGYQEDLKLAAELPGLDLIVGGHSHSLLGDARALSALGLRPEGPYPTEVRGPDGRTVLVAQAWKWGEMLGALTLRFDAAGNLSGYAAAPRLLAGEAASCDGAPVPADSPRAKALRAALAATGLAAPAPEDPDMLRRLEPYARQIAGLQNAPVGARAAADLVRGTPSDPGPLVADAFLRSVPGAQIALVNAGGLRRDLLAGDITLGMVLGVLPFGNTLVRLELSGAELKQALEEGAEFRISTRPPENRDLRRIPRIHCAGLSYELRPERPFGQRVHDLRLRLPDGSSAPLDPAASYSVVVSSFLAGGGDGMAALKAAAKRLDTGILEHDALAAHLAALKTVTPPAEERVRIVLEPGRLRSALDRPWPALPLAA